MRAVLDPNVIISALISPDGTPARILRSWLDGAFELVVSASLLAELERALAYPKLRRRVEPAESQELIALLRDRADTAIDLDDPPNIRSSDPGDDYLLALAATARAVIVSGDRHLLDLAGRAPIYSPAQFWSLLTPAS